MLRNFRIFPSSISNSSFLRRIAISVPIVCGIGYVWLSNNSTGKHIKKVRFIDDDSNLKITLYQYQSCPFCSKVRTYLNVRGISYNLVHVDFLMKSQIRWSKYKKVPFITVEEDDEIIQINESSQILSCLESYLIRKNEKLSEIVKYFPQIEEDGKSVEYPHKYNIIYGDQTNFDPSLIKRQREWREWADNKLLHSFAPNIYRTYLEAVRTVMVYDRVADWPSMYSWLQRQIYIYGGGLMFYVLGKLLARKYHVDSNVRLSLYDNVNTWIEAIAGDDYIGGSTPDLADITVFGLFQSIDGSDAFGDLLGNTKLERWYENMKNCLKSQL